MPVTQNKKVETTITLHCDVCDFETSFVEEASPADIPEAAMRFLALSRLSTYGTPPGTKDKVALCSKFCVLKFFQSYEPARKPTEEELAKLKEASNGTAIN